METAQKTMITVETTVNAPLEKAWHVWTEPMHIMQWCFASDDWHCPNAKNDIKTGGEFTTTMAAKDGSMAFDFEGVYSSVIPNKEIAYTMGDGRVAKIIFTAQGDMTHISETFEAETMNSVEMQKGGWQAILDNYKKRVENTEVTDKINFEIQINAPVEKVYKLMIGDGSYQEWTAIFNPTSTFEGSWDKGSKIRFIGTSESGEKGGMVARIHDNIPNQYVSIQHLGEVKGDQEITTGPEVEKWAGSLENYTFIPSNGGTLVKIDMNTNAEFKSYFEGMWPNALQKLKEVCER